MDIADVRKKAITKAESVWVSANAYGQENPEYIKISKAEALKIELKDVVDFEVDGDRVFIG